MIDFKMVYS